MFCEGKLKIMVT